jgi:hypothetical protein
VSLSRQSRPKKIKLKLVSGRKRLFITGATAVVALVLAITGSLGRTSYEVAQRLKRCGDRRPKEHAALEIRSCGADPPSVLDCEHRSAMRFVDLSCAKKGGPSHMRSARSQKRLSHPLGSDPYALFRNDAGFGYASLADRAVNGYYLR